MTKAKPFVIPKREVWEAFKKGKANRGAAGVDGQSIADVEGDLTNNLYKLWNRLSSGSYFPQPVRRVDIPKATGGTRPLGIPRGWINYYSHFYKSALYASLRRIDFHLKTWVRRKFKRFRQSPKGAREWLARIIRINPELFAHWPLLYDQRLDTGSRMS